MVQGRRYAKFQVFQYCLIFRPQNIALKKGITILFLGIYFFNLVGYQGVFVFFEQSISGDIITQLDKGEYSDAELVEIKIPYPMLYNYNWPEYKRYDGELEMNGIHYNYVKRKLSNDTLYLMCIPNREKTKLAAAKIDYLKNINDAVSPVDGKKSGSHDGSQKAFSLEHHNLTASYNVLAPAIAFSRTYPAAAFNLINVYTANPFQPPKA